MNRCARAVLIASALLCGAPGAALAKGLTVYSSLPRSGAAHAQTLAIERGARLALQEAGGKAGGQPVRYVPLDDGTRKAGSWVPERAARAARLYSVDDGELVYSAAVSG